MRFKKRTKKRSKHEKYSKQQLKIYNILKNLLAKIFILNDNNDNNNNCAIQCFNKFLFLFFIFNTFLTLTNATCPATFLAQAVSQSKVSTFDFYLTKMDIKSSAECANNCGLETFCQSALYNHELRTCSFSYNKVQDCSITKQRYNTFHLKTDGGESLSIITCIDACSKKLEKHSRSLNNLKQSKNDINKLNNFKDNDLKYSLDSTHNVKSSEIPFQKIIALQPIISVNHSTYQHNKSLHEHYSNINPESLLNNKTLISSQLENSIHKVVENYVKNSSNYNKNNDNAKNFLTALQQLNWIQMNANKESQSNIKNTINEKTSHNDTKFLNKLIFSVQPLTIEEIFKQASSVQQAEDTKKNIETFKNHQYDSVNSVNTNSIHSINLLNNNSKHFQNNDKLTTLLKSNQQPDNFILFYKNNINNVKSEFNEKKSSTKSNTVYRSTQIKVTEKEKNNENNKNNSADNDFIMSEPIVINGKVLNLDEKNKLIKRERTTSTTTTTVAPWKPAGLIGESFSNEPESIMTPIERNNVEDNSKRKKQKINNEKSNGYLNTFFIHGLSAMSNKSEKNLNELIKKQAHLELANNVSTITTVSAVPIVCFRSIVQQCLFHASFETIENVTLNECKCECAKTWENININLLVSKQNYCKSLQYNDKSGKCTLNKADHNGKFDLIYDKFVNYYYVSCSTLELLKTANEKCKTNDLKNLNTSSNFITNTTVTNILPIDKNTKISKKTSYIFTTKKNIKNLLSTVKATSTPTYLQTEVSTKNVTTVFLTKDSNKTTTKLSLTKLKKSKNELKKIITKIQLNDTTTTTTIASITKIKKTTTKSDNSFKNKSIVNKKLESKVSTNESIANFKLIDETLLTKNTFNSTIITTKHIKPPSLLLFTKTTQKFLPLTTTEIPIKKALHLKNITINGCFEVIDGYAMNSTAGGLEHDVSLEECQCFCANSFSSQRFRFQCTSVTYYHKNRDCILNLSNRQMNPQVFIENPIQKEHDAQITYAGLICDPIKAIGLHVNNELENGCQSTALNNREFDLLTTSSAHTDKCFLELPNYVLEGNALAIETNVTIEQCKCFCVDSETRYGTMCQSFQYYFDSLTCLLNKENRISNPDRFTYNSGNNVMHSYFDYRCHVEKLTLSSYIEQVCQEVIQLSVKDLLVKKQLLNVDESVNKTQPFTKINSTLLQSKSTLKTTKLQTKKAKKKHINKEFNKLKNKLLTTKTLTTTTASTTTTTTASTTTLTTATPTLALKILETTTSKLKKNSSNINSDEYDNDDDNNSENDEPNLPLIIKSTRVTKIPEQDEMEDSFEQKNNQKDLTPTTITEIASTEKLTTIATTSTLTTTTLNLTKTTTKSTNNIFSEKPFEYPEVSSCRFSALYQTIFSGRRLIKRIIVKSPKQCFAACNAERCRSANLIQMEGKLKNCELFRDSIVDFQRTDVLEYDQSAVHFDSIQCGSDA